MGIVRQFRERDERYARLPMFAQEIARARYQEKKRPAGQVSITVGLEFGPRKQGALLRHFAPMVVIPRSADPLALNWRWAAGLDLLLFAAGRPETETAEFRALDALIAISPAWLRMWSLHSGKCISLIGLSGRRECRLIDRVECPLEYREYVFSASLPCN